MARIAADADFFIWQGANTSTYHVSQLETFIFVGFDCLVVY